jgi:hypothetical protein
MLTFLAWVVLAAPVALAALWVTGEYILQNPGPTHEIRRLNLSGLTG